MDVNLHRSGKISNEASNDDEVVDDFAKYSKDNNKKQDEKVLLY